MSFYFILSNFESTQWPKKCETCIPKQERQGTEAADAAAICRVTNWSTIIWKSWWSQFRAILLSAQNLLFICLLILYCVVDCCYLHVLIYQSVVAHLNYYCVIRIGGLVAAPSSRFSLGKILKIDIFVLQLYHESRVGTSIFKLTNLFH